MTDLTKGYTVKSNATRGAKRMGLVNFVIDKDTGDGLWYIVPVAGDKPQTTGEVVDVFHPDEARSVPQPLEPGMHTVTVTDVSVDPATGAAVVKMTTADGHEIVDKVKADFSEPQPPLSTETAAAVNKLHGMAHADLAKLAKSLGAPVASSNEEIQKRRAARRAEKGIPEPVPVTNTKLPSYKDMSAATSGRKSDIEKPVAVVHAYLRENWGTKSRKALIADLVAKGINISTCRTQYQIVKGRIEAERAAAALETKV